MGESIKKVCITGGIGSGKSVVSAIISDLGYTVLDTDSIAKKLLNSDSSLQKAIIDCFGAESYTDGVLNNKYLSSIVFNNPLKLDEINQIVHPAVINHISHIANGNASKDSLLFIESAIVFEANLEEHFDFIIAVIADDEIRLNRLQEREKDNYDSVKNRVKSQMSSSEVASRADYVITNNLGMEDLKQECKLVLEFITAKNSNSEKII